MSGDLTIRFVTRQDYAQWLPLWDGYNAFYGRSGPTALAPEITAMTWARFFDAYEPVHALVAKTRDGCSGSPTTCSIAARPRSRRIATCRISTPTRRRAAKALAGR